MSNKFFSKIYNNGYTPAFKDNVVSLSEENQIILTYTNPSYTLPETFIQFIFNNNLDNQILDITGKYKTGEIIFPFEDFPTTAHNIIKSFKLTGQNSLWFKLRRKQTQQMSNIIIRSLSNTHEYIIFNKVLLNSLTHNSNSISLWNEEDGEENVKEYYVILQLIDNTPGYEKIRFIFNKESQYVNKLTPSFYSNETIIDKYTLTQNISQNYDFNSWTIFGPLKGKKGTISSIISAIQKPIYTDTALHHIKGSNFYSGININNTTNWDYFTHSRDTKDPVIVQDSLSYPQISWGISCEKDLLLGETMGISLELKTGTFGTIGSTYVLFAQGIGQNRNILFTITVEDEMGIVKQGFGEQSFFPYWITTAQEYLISKTFNNNLENYFANTGDQMSYQGAYYHSLPLLKIIDFAIANMDGTTIDSFEPSFTNYLSLDITTQSFDKNAIDILENVKNNIFTILDYTSQIAVYVFEITTTKGTYITGNLFETNNKYNWGINNLNITKSTPILINGKNYYSEIHITATNPSIDIKLSLPSGWDQQINDINNKLYGLFIINSFSYNGNVLPPPPYPNNIRYSWIELEYNQLILL